MTSQPQTGRTMTYDETSERAERGRRDVGPQIFLWVAWALAFAFWALTMSTFFGILRSVATPGPDFQGGVDAGGAGFFLFTVVGVVVLGLALAWAVMRWATRDKRLDAVTEASTAALYDSVERRGGDDVVSRSPEARRPQDRDSYRPA